MIQQLLKNIEDVVVPSGEPIMLKKHDCARIISFVAPARTIIREGLAGRNFDAAFLKLNTSTAAQTIKNATDPLPPLIMPQKHDCKRNIVLGAPAAAVYFGSCRQQTQ